MKKLTLIFAVAFAVVGSAMAQMAIPGEIFASNPSRYNGRKVTLKNLEIVKTDAHGGPSIGGPAGTFQGAPGAVGTPSAPARVPCMSHSHRARSRRSAALSRHLLTKREVLVRTMLHEGREDRGSRPLDC